KAVGRTAAGEQEPSRRPRTEVAAGTTVALKGLSIRGAPQRAHLDLARAWSLVGDAAAGIPVGRVREPSGPGGHLGPPGALRVGLGPGGAVQTPPSRWRGKRVVGVPALPRGQHRAAYAVSTGKGKCAACLPPPGGRQTAHGARAGPGGAEAGE